MDAPIEPNFWAVLLAAAAAVVGGVAHLRVVLSRDKTEIVKNRVDAGLAQRLEKRADDAIKEAEESREDHIENREKIAMLTAEGKYILADNKRLTAENLALKDELKNREDYILNMFSGLPHTVQGKLVSQYVELDSSH